MNLRKDHYWFCLTLILECVGEQTWHARSGSPPWVRSSYIWNCLVTERLCVSILFVTLPWSWTVLFRIVVKMKNYWKILSGGSLGSYVDEGRSKMREIVWIAGHIEHRYSERKLQSKARLCSTPVWGSLLNHSNFCIGKYECVSVYTLTRSGGNWLISSRWLVYAQLFSSSV